MCDARRYGRISRVHVGEIVHSAFIDVFFHEGQGL